jgi:hypothetical protein
MTVTLARLSPPPQPWLEPPAYPDQRIPARRSIRGNRHTRCVFEADDLNAAIALASLIPAARMGGAVEVRPLVER